MSDPAFVYVIYIRTTPQKLWDALLDPTVRPKIWFGRTVESDWKVGSRHVLTAPDGSIDFQGVVLESDPPRKLSFTFETASPTTTVTYLLEPVEDSVRLTVTHDGFPDNSQQRKGVSNGWPAILSALKSLLENGEPTPQVMPQTNAMTVEAKAQTMIRAPVAKVFEAFIDPAVTTKFWFSKGSGPLKAGETVRWDWEMYGAGDDIHVRAIEADRSIVYDWGGEGNLSKVEMTFTALDDGQTFVEVTNSGFQGDAESVVAQALDSNGGFTTVLCAAKVWLENGINARLIEDKYPQALKPEWAGR